jgi:hypothetical protein
MPTILRVEGYRFFFFSNEGSEPPHVHVEQAERYAKFWLNPVSLARNRGFRTDELTELHQIVVQNKSVFLRAWHERFEN